MKDRTATLPRTALAAGAAALLAVSGATAAQAAPAGTAEPRPVCNQAAHPPASDVVAAVSRTLPEHQGLSPIPPFADVSGYDPCADLSWITVPYGVAESAPHHVLLFHQGAYLGTATLEPQAYEPLVGQVSGDTVRVVYQHPQGVVADSAFTWDPATGSVIHTGTFPAGA